jgi:hypothetical protein
MAIPKKFHGKTNSKRIAYMAQVGNKWSVDVDGQEGKPYDDISKGSFIFSPDSKRFAYIAQVGNKWFVVIDEQEGPQYDGLVDGKMVFDSPKKTSILYPISSS